MVYRAFDRTLSDTVAVKLLRPEVVVADADAYAHFKQELRLARRVTHRNVVRTHDLGESDGVPFITMEFVDGKSLAEIIRARGALSTTVVVAIAKQLLRALVAAHAQQVVHGDLKPQNLLIGPNGVLKVSDFGVARLVRDPWRGARPRDANDAAENTSRLRGAVIGTPEYMAPEQLIGGSATVQSDIYAAGIVLHECVSGTTPYRADTPMAFFARKLDTPVSIVTPDRHVPTMRAPRASNSVVEQIIAHMTAHDAGSRPISASVLLARFSRVLNRCIDYSSRNMLSAIAAISSASRHASSNAVSSPCIAWRSASSCKAISSAMRSTAVRPSTPTSSSQKMLFLRRRVTRNALLFRMYRSASPTSVMRFVASRICMVDPD